MISYFPFNFDRKSTSCMFKIFRNNKKTQSILQSCKVKYKKKCKPDYQFGEICDNFPYDVSISLAFNQSEIDPSIKRTNPFVFPQSRDDDVNKSTIHIFFSFRIAKLNKSVARDMRKNVIKFLSKNAVMWNSASKNQWSDVGIDISINAEMYVWLIKFKLGCWRRCLFQHYGASLIE